jgi:hypothetical protein
MKQPGAHAPALHTSPEAHALPSVTFVHVVVLVVGWQDWHALLGFAALAA